MTTDDADALARAVSEVVCEASAGERLLDLDEIRAQLVARGLGELLAPDPETEAPARLAAVLAGLPGIATLESLSGRRLYHDPARLSRTYARILDRKGCPVALMAEEIRSNSREYPRPVPVELFEAPPFHLSPQAIEAALKAMADDPGYGDIAFTTTSMGAVYLFSSRYLPRRHAAFLAEQDEQFALNP